MKFKTNMLGTVSAGSLTTHLLLNGADYPRFACYELKGKKQPFTYVRTNEDHKNVSCKACRKILSRQIRSGSGFLDSWA